MEPEAAVAEAVRVADDGLARGEMPIGAVVFAGEDVIGRAFTQEQSLGRRIVHADLLAMIAADEHRGFDRSAGPLTLAVNLEPCLMCLGAAITLGVERVFYGLASPNDGGVELLAQWRPPVEQQFFRRPREIRGGFQGDAVRRQFAGYAEGSGPAGMRAWARELAGG